MDAQVKGKMHITGNLHLHDKQLKEMEIHCKLLKDGTDNKSTTIEMQETSPAKVLEYPPGNILLRTHLLKKSAYRFFHVE
jgi:hypothetical protein